MDAYDYYQQGLAILSDPTKFTAQGTAEARDRFENAIKLDRDFWRAYAELAYVNVREAQNGWSANRVQSLRDAEDLAQEALRKHPDGSDAHWSLASVYWNQGRFADSFTEYDNARHLEPTDPDLDADEAEARIYGGEPDKAAALIKDAIIRDAMVRKIPYWYWWNLGRAYYMAGQYEEAIDAIAKIPNPPKDVLLVTAASHAQLGNLTAANADVAAFRAYDPDWTLAKSGEYPYDNPSHRQHWLDGLRQAGLP
jgi:adenylate cyclase